MKFYKWAGQGYWIGTFLLSAPAFAMGSGDLKYDVEPIVGYERVQKFLPTPHTHDRLTYGVRATAGLLMLSAEGEYTRGTDSESFPAQGVDTKDTDDMLKLGLVSQYRLGQLLTAGLRGGVQASKNIHESTANGVLTKTTNPVVYHPYAGFLASASLSTKVALTAGITVVFHDFPSMKQNDYQTSLGLTLQFP